MRVCLVLLFGALMLPNAASAADPTPAPVRTATPFVIPTLPPNIDPRIVDAVRGVVTDLLRTQHERSVNTAHGAVSYFRRFDLQVIVGNNTYRDVHLHTGTVINPRGATLSEGQTVDVQGRGRADGSLEADTITIVSGL